MRYALSEDATTLRLTANAVYRDERLKYSTPYKFKGRVPKAESSGPIYANTFTYFSSQLPVPKLTDELKAQLIASIKDSYASESGAEPAPKSPQAKAMAQELQAANDDQLTSDEIAIFLTHEWLRDGGAALKAEIDNAQAFAVKRMLQDLNDTTIPSMTGEDEMLDSPSDDRIERRIGRGIEAGSYVSSPKIFSALTTFGNAIAIAPSQEEKIKELTQQAKAAQKVK